MKLGGKVVKDGRNRVYLIKKKVVRVLRENTDRQIWD